MKRSTFLTSLVCGAFALPHLAAAETSDDNAIYDTLDAILKARFGSDFPTVLSFVHSRALGLFRDVLSARFDQFLHYYPMENLLRVSGFSAHPKSAKFTDADVFLTACNAAKERHPDFVGDPKRVNLSILGTVFESPRIAHVLFTCSRRVQTEHTDFEDVRPDVFSFRREGEDWLLYSNILSEEISSNWWRDLAEARDTVRWS